MFEKPTANVRVMTFNIRGVREETGPNVLGAAGGVECEGDRTLRTGPDRLSGVTDEETSVSTNGGSRATSGLWDPKYENRKSARLQRDLLEPGASGADREWRILVERDARATLPLVGRPADTLRELGALQDGFRTVRSSSISTPTWTTGEARRGKERPTFWSSMLEEMEIGQWPILISGDFNTDPGTPVHGIFAGAGFEDAHSAGGKSARPYLPPLSRARNSRPRNPDREGRIDWLLARSGAGVGRWTSRECAVVRDAEPPLYPSDHYPSAGRVVIGDGLI